MIKYNSDMYNCIYMDKLMLPFFLALIAKKLSPVTSLVSFPVQLGREITITCKANKVRNVKIGNESIDDNFGAGTWTLYV